MASIKMIEPQEATGKVKEIYQQIMDQFGIDFVPNMYKVMGHKPDFLEAQWNRPLRSCGARNSTLSPKKSSLSLCQRFRDAITE